ncbi:MAG: hypothetical protein ABW046_22735 [Actinoplanes sp.]
MKSFKFEPVRWATGALALIGTLIGANELVHDTTGTDVIPAGATPYLIFASVVLTLILGGAVRARVTPLAAPKDAADTPLVPKSFTTDEQRERGRGLGMAGW